MSDKAVRWILTNAPRATAERYAYGSTAVVKAYEGAGYGPVTLLVVTDLAGADYPADYQAARLHSGLYTAVVCETYADAYAAMMRAHTNGDWSPLSA